MQRVGMKMFDCAEVWSTLSHEIQIQASDLLPQATLHT